MTQVYCRAQGGKGMVQAAWKYAMKRENCLRNVRDARARKEAAAEAKRKSVSLPKLKWMGEA